MAARIVAVNEIALDKRDVETRLSPKAYLRLTKRGALPRDFAKAKFPNLEGFLFPATYSFTKNTTTRGLVNMQLEAFTNAWAGVDLNYAKSKNLNAYDVLIIASMVEKEVQVPKERPLVAAVIYNRLKAGMRARDRRDDSLRARHPANEGHPREPARLRLALQHARSSSG